MSVGVEMAVDAEVAAAKEIRLSHTVLVAVVEVRIIRTSFFAATNCLGVIDRTKKG
ncbi:hypothetical protein D3C85_1836330 [compost metagenome]|jgi:hypothetical protein